MSSAPLPKAARGALFVALLIALLTGIGVRSGPIMLLGFCVVALFAAAGILMRRVWSAYGMAMLMAVGILVTLIFTVTGQNLGTFAQVLVRLVLYSAIAGLFVLAGLSLKVEGGKQGSPVPWILIALMFSVPFIFYKPVSVTNGDALLIGDFVLVDRFAHVGPGDLVAFRSADGQILVKRVASQSAGQYSVRGDAPNSAPQVVAASSIVGKPKFIYDSMGPDPTDVGTRKDTPEQERPVIHRWERVFKTL